MNRTQRLMASVAAAVAMFESQGTPLTAGPPETRGDQAPAGGAKSHRGYTEREAADAVFPKVDVFRPKALTLEDLRKRLPSMDAKTIVAGLDRLIYDGKIKKIGAGTPEEPYKYYRNESLGGG
jgi:hypothetical protein